MPSSKGEPDNPELREKVKEEVKAMSKGGGPGSWSAWKAGELARQYEAKGGGYKDTGDNKNKAKPGVPEKKDEEDNKTEKKKNQSDEKREEEKDDSKDEKKEDKKDETKGGSKAKGGKKK
ncbi:hypothetical protein H2198_008437 [Neophaeococcomyces mojaviensis]|uniref:Uncharacterized protein n=1 Tax=Neophaeococcomyces mojaviensis TaxID=3383035 RepID=A0ACC2ZXG0_9EURO|nr:hypothetical protein H2198_008437 [Knufia sp. JES_112]